MKSKIDLHKSVSIFVPKAGMPANGYKIHFKLDSNGKGCAAIWQGACQVLNSNLGNSWKAVTSKGPKPNIVIPTISSQKQLDKALQHLDRLVNQGHLNMNNAIIRAYYR